MEKLTIEQKAQRYDKAIRESSKIIDYCAGGANIPECINAKAIIEQIFPELKENKDVKIKKCISDIVRERDWSHIFGVTKEDCLAWLEKQGEQKSYGQRQECVDCQFNYAGECKGSCAMKRNEQKPAEWSEEDENRFTNLIFLVKCSKENDATKEGFIKFINKIKSIK